MILYSQNIVIKGCSFSCQYIIFFLFLLQFNDCLFILRLRNIVVFIILFDLSLHCRYLLLELITVLHEVLFGRLNRLNKLVYPCLNIIYIPYTVIWDRGGLWRRVIIALNSLYNTWSNIIYSSDCAYNCTHLSEKNLFITTKYIKNVWQFRPFNTYNYKE